MKIYVLNGIVTIAIGLGEKNRLIMDHFCFIHLSAHKEPPKECVVVCAEGNFSMKVRLVGLVRGSTSTWKYAPC